MEYAAKVGGLARADRGFGWAMTAPGLAALLLVVLFPLLFAVFTSAFDYTLLHRSYDTFVGFDNYRSAFADPYFSDSLMVTFEFVIAVVIIEFVIGFTVALMLDAVTRLKDIYYLILLMPLLINPVVVGLIWRMFLHPELGIVNYLLKLFHIGRVNWLGDVKVAFWTVVLVDIWHQVSFMIILLLAGLSALPREPYEAARMDGASSLQAFFYVTLPLMRPVIAVTLLIRPIFAVKTLDLGVLMTRCGAGTSADFLSYYIKRSALFGLDTRQASAISGLPVGIGLGMTAYLFRYMRSLT